MQFSIIIPAYNAEYFIGACLRSVLNQSLGGQHFEVILVDDCSTDSTLHIASRLAMSNKNLVVARTDSNSGPGIARNIGLSKTSGDWVMFVDSDDYLDCHALDKLHTFLDRNDIEPLDAIGFNWEYGSTSLDQNCFQAPGRRDYDSLWLNRHELIKKYLSLRMDGSVIYTAVRRQLITDNNLQFASGYHEDVDYIFKVYWHARRVSYLDEVLYFKRWRVNSIVSTISARHIYGFMRAWKEIGDFVAENGHEECGELLPYYELGLIGVVATRVREIYRRSSCIEEAYELYDVLYRCYLEIRTKADDSVELPLKTKYSLIAQYFVKTIEDDRLDNTTKAEAIREYIDGLIAKSWSCTDLHSSLFLAPDQIRTCCKRFFVDGKMHGDVSLLNISAHDAARLSSGDILKAKQKLLDRINSGEATDCDGCPFLEFKDWGPLASLDLRYLSLEYHSVCNLRCAYCSDTYYGGVQSQYDVNALIDDLLKSSALTNCGEVVWGGGEPVLDKAFVSLIGKISTMLPYAHQRVLTNAVKHSSIVQRLLGEGRASITTSIDAGTDETYALVRGRPELRTVLGNLAKYVAANASCVTIKYVFTEQNSSLSEVKAFVSLMQQGDLAGCNFQISYDFKKETVPVDTVISMVAMFGLLSDAGFHVIYFDDLLRQRLTEIHSTSGNFIEAGLDELGLGHALASKDAFKIVAIWGAGWQAKYMIENSVFFKHAKVKFLVDETPSKIGGRFLGYDIVAPSALLDSDIPVVIAAVQGFPAIYKSYVELGIDKSRLVSGLIL